MAADEVYDGNTALHRQLEKLQLGYVPAMACDHRVTTDACTTRADTLITSLPRRAWQRVSAGKGAPGRRYYDWALLDLDQSHATGTRWLLARRNRCTGELAYYRCHTPQPAPLSILVTVAGHRWTVEESFPTTKGQTELDQPSTRCAAGTPDIAGRRWYSSRTHSRPSPPPPPAHDPSQPG